MGHIPTLSINAINIIHIYKLTLIENTFLDGAAKQKQFITTTNRTIGSAKTTDDQIASYSYTQNK